VKYEFRPFPTAGGEITLFAAQVAECAEVQQEGGFWASYAILYDVALKGQYTVDGIARTLAGELDLDLDDLMQCAADAEQILIDLQFGLDLGIQGTPAVMVRYGDAVPEFIELDGQIYDLGGVPEDVLRTVIEAAQDIEPTPTGSK
jgi:protein-disulfide isomerase